MVRAGRAWRQKPGCATSEEKDGHFSEAKKATVPMAADNPRAHLPAATSAASRAARWPSSWPAGAASGSKRSPRTAASRRRRSAASSASSISCCRTASTPASARSAVLTQYKAQSLIQHVQRGWSYLRGEFGEFVEVIPAQQQIGKHWYRGTADCGVPEPRPASASHRPKHVLVLAGDHIYKMDYGPMIAYHVEKGADITVGVVEVPRDAGTRLRRADGHRVEPRHQVRRKARRAGPDARAARTRSLASMGIYVFNTQLLEKLLTEDAADPDSAHDFGKNIIPQGDRQPAGVRLSVPGRAARARRATGATWAPSMPIYDANLELVHVDARAQHLRRGLADLDLPGAAAAREVRPRRGRAARHGDQLAWCPAAASSPARWCASRCCSPTCASTSVPSSSAR